MRLRERYLAVNTEDRIPVPILGTGIFLYMLSGMEDLGGKKICRQL